MYGVQKCVVKVGIFEEKLGKEFTEYCDLKYEYTSVLRF